MGGQTVYQKVVVPLDGSELAECVLPHVETIAKGCSPQSIIFVRVVEPVRLPNVAEYSFSARDIDRIESAERVDAENYLKKVASRYADKGWNVQTQLIKGMAADAIAEYAEKNGADLIVIATHGRSGMSRWVWGSVADRVLHASCVPVLMVRAPGCVSGV